MTIEPADLEAVLRFLTTEEGGRTTPCWSGDGFYRAPCDFRRVDGWNDVLFKFKDKEWVAPGETVTARMKILFPDLLYRRLSEGFEFTVHEGRRLVATGRITQIFRPDLRRE